MTQSVSGHHQTYLVWAKGGEKRSRQYKSTAWNNKYVHISCEDEGMSDNTDRAFHVGVH
jgi:hypothetical protein